MAKHLFLNKNLLIIYSVTLIAIQGVSSLTPAFPEIRRAFDISIEEVGLLITFFTFPGVILTPVMGVLADRYGRKKVIIPSLFLFGIAGFACFFTLDFSSLLILRFFQGVGAASIGSLNITLIGDIFSGHDRSSAMGYNASVLSLGTFSYPLIGGGLATLGWNYPFLLPPLAIIVGLLVLMFLKNPEPSKDSSLKEYFKATWQIITQKSIIGLFSVSVLTFVILYGPYLSYFPFLIGDTFDKPPHIIGLIISSASLATIFSSAQIGKFIKKYSERKLMLYSCLLYFLSMIMIPFIDNVWLLILPSVLFGLAQGMNLPSLQSLLTSLAPINQRGAIMSMNGMVLRLGQTLGPVLMAPVYAFGDLFSTFYVGSVIAVIMFVMIFIFVGKRRELT
jgi:MFS transporter, ACDE family, multidrug resistance protein